MTATTIGTSTAANAARATAETRQKSVTGQAFGVDIGSLAASLVDDGVRRAVESEVATVSNQAVKQAITEDVRQRLRERAVTAAQDAIIEQLDTEEESEEPAPELYYGSVDEWVREWLRWTYRRHCDGRNRYWSAEWWRSGEATSRLESLWRAWEELRLDEATGMSVWWRDHCDHHMPILMSDQGPFVRDAAKPENRNEKGDPLPYAPAPEGMFPDVRELDDESQEKQQ